MSRRTPRRVTTGSAPLSLSLSTASALGSRSVEDSTPLPYGALRGRVVDIADVPRRGPYRPWAALLQRTFGFDVLECPRCDGRMRLLAMVTDPIALA